MMSSVVSTRYTSVTDRQTPHRSIAYIPLYAYAAHKKTGQMRSIGLKSGGTNSEGERGTLWSRGEKG